MTAVQFGDKRWGLDRKLALLVDGVCRRLSSQKKNTAFLSCFTPEQNFESFQPDGQRTEVAHFASIDCIL